MRETGISMDAAAGCVVDGIFLAIAPVEKGAPVAGKKGRLFALNPAWNGEKTTSARFRKGAPFSCAEECGR